MRIWITENTNMKPRRETRGAYLVATHRGVGSAVAVPRDHIDRQQPGVGDEDAQRERHNRQHRAHFDRLSAQDHQHRSTHTPQIKPNRLGIVTGENSVLAEHAEVKSSIAAASCTCRGAGAATELRGSQAPRIERCRISPVSAGPAVRCAEKSRPACEEPTAELC